MNLNIGYCLRVGIGVFAMVFGFFLAAAITCAAFYGFYLLFKGIDERHEAKEDNDRV